MKRSIQAALLAAMLSSIAAGGASAKECKAMMGGIEAMIQKAEPDAPPTEQGKCAAFGEFVGAMKAFRIISDECLPEGEPRFKALAGLDRTIRALTTEVDKKCK